jgi:hypothetical protein
VVENKLPEPLANEVHVKSLPQESHLQIFLCEKGVHPLPIITVIKNYGGYISYRTFFTKCKRSNSQ